MNKKNKTWTRIKKYREELEKVPNGWPLSAMVGSEYLVHNTYKKRKELRNAQK